MRMLTDVLDELRRELVRVEAERDDQMRRAEELLVTVTEQAEALAAKDAELAKVREQDDPRRCRMCGAYAKGGILSDDDVHVLLCHTCGEKVADFYGRRRAIARADNAEAALRRVRAAVEQERRLGFTLARCTAEGEKIPTLAFRASPIEDALASVSPPPSHEQAALTWTLANIYTIARRWLRKMERLSYTDEDRDGWRHVIRLCEKVGCEPRGVLRDNGGPVVSPPPSEEKP